MTDLGDVEGGLYFNPGGMVSQLALRSYDAESLSELEPLHELVDGIVTGHRMLVPGRLYPQLLEWRDQLASVIEAKRDEAGEPGKPHDRYTEIGYDKNPGPQS